MQLSYARTRATRRVRDTTHSWHFLTTQFEVNTPQNRRLLSSFDLFCLVWIPWSSGVPSVNHEIIRSGWRRRAERKLLSHRETFHKQLPVKTLWYRTKIRPRCLKLGTVPLPYLCLCEKKTHSHSHAAFFSLISDFLYRYISCLINIKGVTGMLMFCHDALYLYPFHWWTSTMFHGIYF